MNNITFILGGARSGKSSYSLELAKKNKSKKTAFIATCQALDNEMEKRINIHKKTRPSSWKTFEEPMDVSGLLKNIGDKYEVIVLDCLTLLVSNLLLKNNKQKMIESEISKILSIMKKNNAENIIVSNEVGLGIVPENKLARDFRDIAGRVNQIVVEKSDKVFFMVSGIPWRIK
jgi:adenosylcobinamide kinase/adenosylcobinamide-phosphate guanylyltransferase